MKGRKRKKTFGVRRNKTYLCDACKSIFPSLTSFKSHLSANIACKNKLPFCCDFCGFIGYDSTAWGRHMQFNPSCQHFYKEKDVTTGMLPDLSVGKIPYDPYKPNQTSFSYQRYSMDGKLDYVNLNIHNEDNHNLSGKQRMTDFIHQDHISSDLPSSYLDTARLMTSMLEEGANSSILDNEASYLNEYVSIATREVIDEGAEPLATDYSVHDEIEEMTSQMSNMDLRNEQADLLKNYNALSLTQSDIICLDLYHMLKASNAPLIMYNRIIDFMKRNESILKSDGTSSLMQRDKLINCLNRKMYNNRSALMKPKLSLTKLSSGRTTNVVTFSFREMVLKMVANKTLFHPDNLLLDPDNPFADPVDDGYYGDVNSGDWFLHAKTHECKRDNEILMPFCHFIDGLSIDKYGKLTVEAVMSCCLWFNRKARNRSSSWFVQGFIEDQKLFRDQHNYVRGERLQDYHDMMTQIFKEMKDIYDAGGIRLTLDFGKDRCYDVVAIPVIQYIIGDCKGNDVLCGRKGGHSLSMGGLCRDCDISPQYGDDVCLDTPLRCNFICKDNVVGKSKEELERLSFIPIKNCFHSLSFGGCSRNIYGGTPAEMLHAVLLGLCDYISDGLEMIFTESSLDSISHVVAGIYQDCRRQSERNLPSLGPFRNGIMSVKSLKATERFARIYSIVLALSNSFLIERLCSKKRKRGHDSDKAANISIKMLVKLVKVMEDTLIFHLWLKKDKFKKDYFKVYPGNTDSKAMDRIKRYLYDFKGIITRQGNNLKTPKFHQMLHVCDYIMRHGSPLNYDGSRGENYGKIKIKDNAKLTNRQKVTLNFDIGRRICEEDIINEASNIHYQNTGIWPSKFCNDVDIAKNAKRFDVKSRAQASATMSAESKPRFTIMCTIEENEHDNNLPEEVNVQIDWGGQSRTPFKSFQIDLLKKVAARLYIGSPNLGGKVDRHSKVCGYTELHINDQIYRAHPFYASTGPWYDWAYFSWEGLDDTVPAQILMILDLSSCEISYDPDINTDHVTGVDSIEVQPHLTKDKWMVVAAAESPTLDASLVKDSHIELSIIKRVKLPDDNIIWLVPLSSLRGPCFVVPNRNYCQALVDNETTISDGTAYVVKPMHEWADVFLNDSC